MHVGGPEAITIQARPNYPQVFLRAGVALAVRCRFVKSVWIKVHGRRAHARVADEAAGTPIVLVHGIGVSSAYLVPTALALASDHPVYAPDLPGFGRSKGPSRALNVAQLAEELLAWMDAMGLARPVLLGNSFGCQVIVALSVAAPERVAALVLLGPTVDPRWRTFLRQIPRWIVEGMREPWSIFPILALDYLRCGTRRFLGTARFALANRMEDALPSVHAPTLVVRGGRDAFVSPAWAERVTNLLSNGELATLAGAAHAANYSAPDEVARVVRAFLARSCARTEQVDGPRSRFCEA